LEVDVDAAERHGLKKPGGHEVAIFR